MSEGAKVETNGPPIILPGAVGPEQRASAPSADAATATATVTATATDAPRLVAEASLATGDAPTATKDAPTAMKDAASETEDASAASEDAASETEDASAATEDAASEAEDASAATEDAASEAEDASAATEDAASEAEDASAASEDAAPEAEDASAASEDAAPETEDASAASEDAAPETEDASAASADAPTAIKDASPASEDAASEAEDAGAEQQDEFATDSDGDGDGDEASAEELVREPGPGSLALLKLDRIDDDDAFRLRPEGDIDNLATSIARLGQMFPVDLRWVAPDRFQIVAGFRRVAALRLLKRERVLARVHTDLTEEDALRVALADLLENKSASKDELATLRQRLESECRLTAPVREAIDRILSPVDESLGPETVEGPEEEVDLDELAQDIARRLAVLNQDLALVAELWNAMDPTLRHTLLEQLAYPEQLASYLRSL